MSDTNLDALAERMAEQEYRQSKEIARVTGDKISSGDLKSYGWAKQVGYTECAQYLLPPLDRALRTLEGLPHNEDCALESPLDGRPCNCGRDATTEELRKILSP